MAKRAQVPPDESGDLRGGGAQRRSGTGADTPQQGGQAVAPAATQEPFTVDGYPLTVYPPTQSKHYYQVVWQEEGRRRSTSAGKTLEAAQEKVSLICARIDAQAFKADRPVRELADTWRDPARARKRPWSPKYQIQVDAILNRKVKPAIGDIVCSRLTAHDVQRAVDSASTPKEAVRYLRIIKAMVRWGHGDGWFMAAPERLLHNVHPRGAASTTEQGVSPERVQRSKIPTAGGVARLATALAELELNLRGSREWFRNGELMTYLAAYSGVREGELLALRPMDVDVAERRISITRQTVEVKGKPVITEPKGNKHRTTIYPTDAPSGYPLAAELRRRVDAAAEAGGPEALLFPTARGGLWTQSRWGERRVRRASAQAGWERDPETGDFLHTWHSLRHRFAAWLLWEVHVSPADASMALGHSTVAVTLEKYASSPASALDRLGEATG